MRGKLDVTHGGVGAIEKQGTDIDPQQGFCGFARLDDPQIAVECNDAVRTVGNNPSHGHAKDDR